jgi:hypothetical protein
MRIGKLVVYLLSAIYGIVEAYVGLMSMVSVIIVWCVLSMSIILYEHLTNHRASKWLHATVLHITKLISFSRKPRFKIKLNLKVLTQC